VTSPLEKIVHMLGGMNARSPGVSVSRGCIPRFTSADIANAISMANRDPVTHHYDGAADILQLIYNPDALNVVGPDAMAKQRAVRSLIIGEMVKMIAPRDIAIQKLAAIRDTAICELQRPKTCRSCDARGVLPATENRPACVCKACSGTGNKPLSSRWRAERMGVSDGAFRKNWKLLYDLTACWIGEKCEEAARRANKWLS
jgi:hypothetical protein